MAELILVEGASGEGKSHSIQYLDPEKTFIINVSGKSLPWKGWKKQYKPFKKKKNSNTDNGGNYYSTDNADKIKMILKWINSNRPEIEHVIIDDFQYMAAFEYFERAQEKGWDKFTDIGQDIFKVLNTARELTRYGTSVEGPELKIFVMTHIQTVEEGFSKRKQMKTIGKMVDEKLEPEGLCTIVFFTEFDPDAETREEAYGFRTQTDGGDKAKSPQGMFDDEVIPNNLQYVSDRIDAYYHGDEEE